MRIGISKIPNYFVNKMLRLQNKCFSDKKICLLASSCFFLISLIFLICSTFFCLVYSVFTTTVLVSTAIVSFTFAQVFYNGYQQIVIKNTF